jgi:hypothetical protein
MTAGATIESHQMKREESLLNLICFIAAAGFIAFVVYNFFAAGSFISTDGLFFTVVPLVLALSFLAVPAMDIMARRRGVGELEVGNVQPQVTAARGAPALTSGAASYASAPALKDAKGRAMPADVNRMVAEMSKKPEGRKQ